MVWLLLLLVVVMLVCVFLFNVFGRGWPCRSCQGVGHSKLVLVQESVQQDEAVGCPMLFVPAEAQSVAP